MSTISFIFPHVSSSVLVRFISITSRKKEFTFDYKILFNISELPTVAFYHQNFTNMILIFVIERAWGILTNVKFAGAESWWINSNRLTKYIGYLA